MKDNKTDTLFKIIGIILIAILVSLFAGRTYGDDNSWSPVHELYDNDFGVSNAERNRLVYEYEVITDMLTAIDERRSDLRVCDPELESKIVLLVKEFNCVNRAYKSVVEAITIFVNNHKGI
jgi:hypothetical protein